MSDRRYFDNTALSAYKKCPRFYYIRHVRGWRGEGLSPALAFGLAWHEAMNVIWVKYNDLPRAELLQLAYFAFTHSWEEQGMPSQEAMSIELVERYSPRLPITAWEMLGEYVDKRQALLSECEVISAEQPFAVPLFEDPNEPWYIGRLDKVIQTATEMPIIEHKSTTDYKKDGGFKQTYIDQWSPNSQVEGYLYGGAMTYGRDKVRQVWVDAALVHKTVHDQFKFIPVSMGTAGLDSWLDETRSWVLTVMDREDAIRKVPTSINFTFPRNTNNCIDFGTRCPYFDICRAGTDVVETDQPPSGLIYEPWKPFDVLEVSKIMGGSDAI